MREAEVRSAIRHEVEAVREDLRYFVSELRARVAVLGTCGYCGGPVVAGAGTRGVQHPERGSAVLDIPAEYPPAHCQRCGAEPAVPMAMVSRRNLERRGPEPSPSAPGGTDLYKLAEEWLGRLPGWCIQPSSWRKETAASLAALFAQVEKGVPR